MTPATRERNGRLWGPGPSSASFAPGLVIAGGYDRGIPAPSAFHPRPEAFPGWEGLASASLLHRFILFTGGGWPRFPPDVTARNDEGLPLMSAPENPGPRRLRPRCENLLVFDDRVS